VTQQFLITNSTLQWLEGILVERFGHKWHLTRSAAGIHLALEGGEGAIVFDVIEPGFTHARSDQLFTQWHAEREGWQSVLGGPLPTPGVAKLPTPLIEKRGADSYVHYDILGLTYWTLARIEEIGRTDLDNHDRFPATSSHAYKHGYLDRPVVDEWLNVLGQVIERQWVGVALRKHEPKIFVTCDLDSPYEAQVGLTKLPRKVAGDLLKRKSVSMALGSIARGFRNQEPSSANDSHLAAIDWMMDVNERAGNRVVFYFITDCNHPLDSHYRMDEPVIRRLSRRIHDRGHEIGLHPSYTSYSDSERTVREANILRSAMEAAGIRQPEIGGRQHFLRWSSPLTARNWEAAGLRYDSTLSYADRAGFRCGTCHEFQMFDPVQDRALKLCQRPLVLMESSVIAARYQGLGYTDEALAAMLDLKRVCKQVSGVFTLLWHNSHLGCERGREFYREIVN
jgi:peptidoglycan/xylan/chitin deacetylase (PgdA/CDA1 family)